LPNCRCSDPQPAFFNSQLLFDFCSKIFFKKGKPKDVYLRGPSFRNIYDVSNGGQQKYCGVTVEGHEEFKHLMHLCTGTRAKEDTHGFEFQFLKKFQRENGILSLDAEENKKAKRRKKNAQVAQESDDEEEEEDDYSVLSEGGPDDDEDSSEEGDVDVTNEE